MFGANTIQKKGVMKRFKQVAHSVDIIAVDCHSEFLAALMDETMEKEEISIPQNDK